MDNKIRKELVLSAKKYMFQLDEYPENEVIRQIEKELDEVIELDEEEVLEMRLKYFGIGKKEDYKHKLILTSEGYIYAGIRYKNGNVEKPFVYLWPAFKIKNIKKIIKEVDPYFTVFKPKYYNFWIRQDMNDYDGEINQQRFIGEVAKLKKHNWDLEKPDSYYDWYKKEHDNFILEYPKFKDRVTINSKELMDECLKQGLLYQYKVGDKILGMVAGEKEEFLGKQSVYIDEILVSSGFRGKGNSSKLLESFVNKLDVTYIYCSIDIDNIGSTKTALKLGEKIFSQELFFGI